MKTDRIVITDRQWEILRLRKKGFPIKLIATRLGIKPASVQNQLSITWKKLVRCRDGEHRLCKIR